MPDLSSFSATLIAFLMVAGQQFVLAAAWAFAAGVMRTVRVAAGYWSVFAALNGLSQLLFVASVEWTAAPLRSMANVMLLLSLVALQRGIRSFFRARHPGGWQLAALLLGIGASWLGMDAAHGAWRIGIVSALLAGLCLGTAIDVVRFTGPGMDRRWGWALAGPLLAGALVLGARTVHAVMAADTITTTASANSALNVGAAFLYLVLTMVFQLTLVSLVITSLVAELRRIARHDPLTGLPNRRAIDEALHDEAHRARRLGDSFAVLMIDADHFKSVNDRFGHAGGDRALQHLAAVMAAQVRDIDRLGRYGGEEFIVLMPATLREEAEAAAQRLRERAAAVPMHLNADPLRLTVSVGLAAWQGEGDTVEALLRRADEALYRAKRNGRNRVEAAGS